MEELTIKVLSGVVAVLVIANVVLCVMWHLRNGTNDDRTRLALMDFKSLVSQGIQLGIRLAKNDNTERGQSEDCKDAKDDGAK